MGRRATGTVFEARGRWFVRVVLATARRAFALAPTDEGSARERGALVAALAADLRAAGQLELAPRLLEAVAGASADDELADAVETTRRVCAGELRPRPTSTMTFTALAEQWVSGELARRWPDHVRAKDSAIDAMRLRRHIFHLVGHVRLADFRLEHAELVMRALPADLGPSTRRQYAQLLVRVLGLAAYPCRIVDKSPLPRGFLPRQSAPKAAVYLYPDEDAKLLACGAVSLPSRLLYGFLAREGMRKSEAAQLTWADVDLDRGAMRLDRNKTSDPRAWSLDPGVVRALAAWSERCGRPDPAAPVFVGADGGALLTSRLAAQLRADLELAGVHRPELFERTSARLPMRLHDLRATFVTIGLATGRTETWIADRTGHTSSVMINRYRRAARSLAELGVRPLVALDQAIPELRQASRTSALPLPAGIEPQTPSAGRALPVVLNGRAGDSVNVSSTGAFEAPDAAQGSRREPLGIAALAEERTRTFTPFRVLEPESGESEPRDRFAPENQGDPVGARGVEDPVREAVDAIPGPVADLSASCGSDFGRDAERDLKPENVSIDFASRAAFIAMLGAFAGGLGQAGDVAAAQVATEALARLLGIGAGELGAVVQLSDRRERR